MANHGRSQARRGYAAERRIVSRLAAYGFSRVPLSGAAGGRWSGDLRGEPGRAITTVEVKHRDAAMKLARRWLGSNDLLIVDEGATVEPLVVLTLATLQRLLEEGGYVLVP